jgi:serine/threonine protein phosphatase PrpC
VSAPANIAGVACPACGAAIAPGDRFCEACGHELPGTGSDAGSGAAAAPTAPVAPVAAVEEPAVACPSCGAVGTAADGYCGVCGMRMPAPRDHEELAMPGLAGVTDKGRRHHRNEDAMAVVTGHGFVAAVVCDGVSSTVDPDVASQAAADAAAAVLAASPPAEPDLDGAYDAARQAVLAVEFAPHPELGPPSCTFLAAMITDTCVSMAALGDCRAYWAVEGAAAQLTVDDSWAMMQIESGALSRAEAFAHPMAHVITRWLAQDADPSWRPAIVRFEPPSSGRLLLVSDGLWNYTLEPDQLVAAMGPWGDEPLEVARRLVTFANQAGGSDNITVVAVDLPLHPSKGTPVP